MSKRIISSLIILISVVGACSNEAEDLLPDQATDTATTVPAMDTEEPTETATMEPTATDAEPEGPPTLTLPARVVDPDAAIEHLAAGSEVVITHIDMQNETTGWAIGGTSDPGNHILFTQNGGETWADVTPPEPAPTGGESTKIAHAFFLDTERAWVTYSFEDFQRIPEFTIVWSTDDSGATWQPSAFLDIRGASMEFYSPQSIQFVDPDNGWLLAAVGAGMSHSYSVLFRTTDGGANWERIIDPFSSPDLHNCCKTGLLFMDADTGLLTQGQGPYTEPFVTWTRDGGLTWLQQPLPNPSSNPYLFDNAFCDSHSPHIFASMAVLVGVACKQFGNDGEATEYFYVYTSLDNGTTWQSSPAEGSGAMFFFDENVGFSLGRDIYFTNDGGLTWLLVKTVNWDGQFSFVNRDKGWVVARNNAGEIAFLTTTDGGETWETIETAIVD